MKSLLLFVLTFWSVLTFSQQSLKGIVTYDNEPVPFSKVKIKALQRNYITNENGIFILDNIKMIIL